VGKLTSSEWAATKWAVVMQLVLSRIDSLGLCESLAAYVSVAALEEDSENDWSAPVHFWHGGLPVTHV
jgi:hypothetical protein